MDGANTRLVGGFARMAILAVALWAMLAGTAWGHDPLPADESLFEDDTLSLLGDDPARAAVAADPRVVCLPDGTDSAAPLVEFVFVTSDRNAPLPRDEMAQAAAWVDRIFADSADIHAPGTFRAVRWLQQESQSGHCEPVVRKVVVDDVAGFEQWSRSHGSWGRFRDSIADAVDLDRNRARRYLVWADLDHPGYCGHGEMSRDTRPEPELNRSNHTSMLAVVYAACHGRINATEAHELVHTFGAVLPLAPNAAGAHCSDHNDRMCIQGGEQTTCPEDVWRRLLDCGGDDYFNPGSPLHSRSGVRYWNTADSVFLTSERPTWWDGEMQPTNDTEERQVTEVTEAPTSSSVPPGFSDTAGHLFADEIATLAASGITRGCAPDQYCPHQPVTRGQMAAFLVRALKLPTDTAHTFADTTDSVFATDISTLAASGITRGCAPDQYCPHQPVTRGQMAAFLVRAGLTE